MNLAAHIAEQAKVVNYARHVTHGMSKDALLRGEYNSWNGMKRRCYNKKSKDYPRYGKIGITVCDEWVRDFSRFFADMGPRLSKSHSLDRKDGTKGYSKDNCRWATKEEQAQNRPEFVISITYCDRTQTLSAWARELGISPQTIYNRHNAGWSVERMLEQRPSNEVRVDNRVIEFQGKKQTLAQWTKEIGICRNGLKERFRRGWSIERALTTPTRGRP